MDIKITNISKLPKTLDRNNSKKFLKQNKNSSSKKNTIQKQSSLYEADEVILSDEGILKQKEMDNTQKIEELQKQIDSNNYKIDAQKIAEKIIENLKIID